MDESVIGLQSMAQELLSENSSINNREEIIEDLQTGIQNVAERVGSEFSKAVNCI